MVPLILKVRDFDDEDDVEELEIIRFDSC